MHRINPYKPLHTHSLDCVSVMYIFYTLSYSLLLVAPRLELLHSSIQSMLHHVTHIHVSLPDLSIRHCQHRLNILQRKAVALDTLKGLSTADESLNILGIAFQYCRTVLDDTIKVGNLFVACGSVGVSFHGQVGLTLAAAFEPIETFGVVFDGDFMGK